MPVFEYRCPECGITDEAYFSHWDNPNPPCVLCGGATERMASRFGIPLSGSIRKYNDLTKENSHQEGFWSYRKVSSVSGQPEPVYLETMEDVRAFNRAEGLAAPGEAPTNATISADGKRILSDGMPGQWRGGAMPGVPSGVWEMTKSLTSLKGKSPEPVASGPPCTIQAVDASAMEKFQSECGG
jgi:putative FmdB family regulatory protein